MARRFTIKERIDLVRNYYSSGIHYPHLFAQCDLCVTFLTPCSIFQQDLAPSNISKKVITRFQNYKIKTLHWSENLFNLNPIENFFKIALPRPGSLGLLFKYGIMTKKIF